MRWSLEAQTWTCFHLSPVGPYFIHIHSDKYGLSWGKSQLIGPLFFILWFCLFFWKTNNLFSCPSGSRAGPTLKTTVYGKKDNSFFQTTVLLKKHHLFSRENQACLLFSPYSKNKPKTAHETGSFLVIILISSFIVNGILPPGVGMEAQVLSSKRHETLPTPPTPLPHLRRGLWDKLC